MNQEPKEQGVFSTKIRTKWYLVNISLFASDLFPAGCKTGEISSDLKQIGSAGVGQNRTCWDLPLTLGIPSSRWGATPFVVRPIPFPCRALDSNANESPKQLSTAPHPFQQALRWQRELATDSQLTKSGIAKREGLSRARVTQIMNLLLLPEVIQQELQNPPPPLKIDLFHEHRLRVLLGQNDKVRQLHDWQQWIEELRAFG